MLKLPSLQVKIYLLTTIFSSLNLAAKGPTKIHLVQSAQEIANYRPVVIKFSARHCGACHMIAKTYEDLSNKYPELHFLEVDGTKADDLMKKYQVKAFPTFVFLKDPAQKPNLVIVGADKEKLTTSVKEFSQQIQSAKNSKKQKAVKEISSLKELEQAVTKAPKMVVAEYHAEAWCPACKMFAQPFCDLADKFEEVVFIKMDDMQAGNKEIAKKHKITALPTTLIFIAGNDQPVEVVVGGNATKLETAIQKHLNAKPKAAQAPDKKATATKSASTQTATANTSAATTGTVQVITSKDQFEKLLKESSQPVVVEYHAEAWCGACKVYKPIFEKMASEYPKFKFIKIDHDVKANQAIAAAYGIGAFPTTLIFQAGKLVKSIVGINLPEIEKALKAL